MNTLVFPLAKKFPQGCKVRRSPSVHATFAVQEKSWARGNEAEKEFRVVAATAKRERDVKNKR